MLEESTSSATVYYIREPSGSLIARLHPTEGIRYYHFDELGSTRLLTNSTGDITDMYAYDAYGSLLSHEAYTGSVDQPYEYVGKVGYYTHYMEPDFSLLQLGVRFYVPEVGRFTQKDALPEDMETAYLYAKAAVLRLRDPRGMRPGDYEECQIKYKTCLDGAQARFGKCIGKSGGVSDIGGGVAKCIIGCGLFSKLIKGSYKVCCAGCVALLTLCSFVDLDSCQKVLDSEKSSYDSAFEYCKRRSTRD